MQPCIAQNINLSLVESATWSRTMSLLCRVIRFEKSQIGSTRGFEMRMSMTSAVEATDLERSTQSTKRLTSGISVARSMSLLKLCVISWRPYCEG